MVHNGCTQMAGVNDENSVGNQRFKVGHFTEDYCHVSLPNPEAAKLFYTKNTTGEMVKGYWKS